MKRVIPTSLLTLGAASLGLTAVSHAEEGGKSPWTFSASMAGFYDNNVYGRSGTVNSASTRVGSFGFEFSPSVRLAMPFNDGASKFIANYTYALRYYDAKAEHVDHAHSALVGFDHKFNDIVSLSLSDSMTYSQQPAQNSDAGAAFRTVGDNLYNVAKVNLDVQVAPLWDVDLTYANTLVRFQDQALREQLDRVEHLPGFDVRYKILETASVLFGYQYKIVNYDNAVRAADGDVTSHRPFVGVDNNWTRSVRSSLRGGIEAISFEKGSSSVDRNSVEPYFDGNVSWDYVAGGTAQVGAKHEWAANSVYLGTATADPARGVEKTTAYVNLTQVIVPDVTGTLSGGYVWGSQIGGVAPINGTNVSLDGQNEDYGYISAKISYRFNSNLSAFAAYNLDILNSSKTLQSVYPGRDYDRSVFKLGVIATY